MNRTERITNGSFMKDIEEVPEAFPEVLEILPESLPDIPELSTETAEPLEAGSVTFYSLEEMKNVLGKTEAELKEEKPPNAPNLSKWFENGGTVSIEDNGTTWRFTDAEGRTVPYVEGYPEFPPEARHPYIDDIDIGAFTGDRNEDKRLYLEKLEEEYGLTQIPEGYALHHDARNGNMQLVRMDYHTTFTHIGGHSLFGGESQC